MYVHHSGPSLRLETKGCQERKDSFLGCFESFVQLDSGAICDQRWVRVLPWLPSLTGKLLKLDSAVY